MAINEEFQTDERQDPTSQFDPELEPERPPYSDFSSDSGQPELEYPPDPPLASFVPDSLAETTRKSGLAWSAGIVFVVSVAFMLLLGWFADLLLGSSPWGLVVGIVLGSVIGFLQFFRITSSIFPKSATQTPPRTLIADEKDDPYA